ncbi:hypothetical protein ARAM_001545 [Aspergillus rambellii]|uniref:Uncharacterized protein n=1 Tax=Aspergillus rambellii TaxID=308745 RepID=A0A0F8U2P8_9EURO|nr:hypothetical protein ARAM_001545 [Aspergillus rambellii]
MPRPPTRRNRLIKPLANAKQAQNQDPSRNDTESGDRSGPPTSDAAATSRLAHSTDPTEIVRQLRNQTPLSKAQELAIASSPAGEHTATGSRPPTRSRGYSSTLSIAGRKGDLSSRIPGTPAFESSVLSNFRRRPRQASILHMMQDDDGSSDFDDDDFLGGLSPEDESTPLNLSRGKSLVIRPAVSPSPVKPSLPSSGKSSKRKRSVDESEAPESALQVASSPSGSQISDTEGHDSDVSVDLPHLPQSPATFSETQVPPMSSPAPSLTHGVSTPDSHHPSSSAKRPKNTTVRKTAKNKNHISTADLQDKFLPRRRRRWAVRLNGNNFEVLGESDDDDIPSAAHEDDDELSYLPSHKPSQSRRKPASKQKPLRNNRTPQETQTKEDTYLDGNKPNPIKQYGSSSHEPTVVEKENELVVDMSSPLSSALDSDAFDSDFLLDKVPTKTFLSDELRLQALKFAEVDRWQMEYEDVLFSSTQEKGTFR